MPSFFSSSLVLAALIGASSPALAGDRGAEVARGEAALAKAIGDRTPGKPVTCVNLRDIRSSQIVDRTAIVYDLGGGRLYVNRPTGGAESLGDDDILVTETYSNQLCRMDIVRLVDRVARFQRGFVNLGDFVPYTRSHPKG